MPLSICLIIFTVQIVGAASPDKYPSQVLGVAEQILFTERCEESLKGKHCQDLLL